MFVRTYYAMKHRMGGEKFTPRDLILWHRMHQCPGNQGHKVPRAELIFKRRVGNSHACYVMYWRAHQDEYKAMKLQYKRTT